MIPTKIKDCNVDGLFYLKNLKNPDGIHAWKKTKYMVERKVLCCRYKNCAQKLMDPEDTVYTINGH